MRNPPEGGPSSGLSHVLDAVLGECTAPEYQHPIWSKIGTGVAFDEKPRPMWGSKGGAIQGTFPAERSGTP
jgi:hypothetical protein